MHHPVRRRILILLMFTGHLGVVTLASTVILAVTAAEGQADVIVQIATLLVAVVVIFVVAASRRLDHLMCAAIGRLMVRFGWLDLPSYEALYEHRCGAQLAEHVVTVDLDLIRRDNTPAILSINGKNIRQTENFSEPVTFRVGDRVLCFGSPDEHGEFAQSLRRKDI